MQIAAEVATSLSFCYCFACANFNWNYDGNDNRERRRQDERQRKQRDKRQATGDSRMSCPPLDDCQSICKARFEVNPNGFPLFRN